MTGGWTRGSRRIADTNAAEIPPVTAEVGRALGIS